MRFYSGFSFRDESPLFDVYLDHGDYTVAGFSYGAIAAAEDALRSHGRVDLLQLFSPAFFQTRDATFRRLQLMGYRRDPRAYLEAFTKLCFAPCEPHGGLARSSTDAEQLETLLDFVWDDARMHALKQRGVRVEVYLGGEDAVIDAGAAGAFFLPHATVYTFNRANHFLQEYPCHQSK